MLVLLALLGCDRDVEIIDQSCTTTHYPDGDGDGYGDEASGAVICETDGYVAVGGDCDDGDAAVHPEGVEACNEADDDCDGLTDEADDSLDPTTRLAWYADADGDGFGDAAAVAAACVEPEGYVADATDCDDADAAVNPDAAEVCGGADDDCDGAVDDADDDLDLSTASSWYADDDADGFGDVGTTVLACAASEGVVADATDCDDTTATAYPGAVEVCDDLDNDCDGATDDSDDDLDTTTASTWYADLDGDTYGDDADAVAACVPPSRYVAVGGDCDPADAAVSPVGTEACNGVDDDCDGALDDDDRSLDLTTASTWYVDADGDAYGDGGLTWSSCEAPARFVGNADDCDDGEEGHHPGAVETCDGADDDCDGVVDEDDAEGASTWYADADGDGYGDASASTSACDAPAGYVADDDDCDDTQALAWPGADEVCDGVNNDCDGETDEEEAVDASTWYADADGDGYGNADDPRPGCDAPAGYVADATDCDDLLFTVNPAAAEACNDTDDDCDGETDESAHDAPAWYADEDVDGYGDAAVSVIACDAPDAYVDNADDCDPDDAALHPGATESCDGVDQDCDGSADEAFFDEDFTTEPSTDVFTVNGDAAVDTTDGVLVLTDYLNEYSTAFLADPISTASLYVELTFELSGGYGTSGADGISFFIVDADTSTDYVYESGGSNLGIRGTTGWVIAVDTYGWGSRDYVSLFDASTWVEEDFGAIGPEVQSSGPHTLAIELESGQVEVWVDGTSVLTSSLSGWTDTPHLVGVSGATGAAWNVQEIDDLLIECL